MKKAITPMRFERGALALCAAGLAIGMALTLTGCQSSASRMAECQAQGISRDACYLAEQNRKQSINAVAQKQAMENAANAVQHAQAAHQAPAEYKPGNLKPINVKAHGIEFKRSRDGFAYINGSLAANDENNADASVYSAGLYSVIVYKSGKISAMKEGQYVGRLK